MKSATVLHLPKSREYQMMLEPRPFQEICFVRFRVFQAGASFHE